MPSQAVDKIHRMFLVQAAKLRFKRAMHELLYEILHEGFAKPHQQSSRTMIRDLQTAFQLLNDDQKLVPMLIVGFAKPSSCLFFMLVQDQHDQSECK